MRDLNEVLDLNLYLPVGGKTYTVKPPSATVGVQLVDRLAFGIAADAGIDLGDEQRRAVEVTDDDLPDFGRQCLGPVLDEMLADGLTWQQVEFCITTAFYAWTVGKEFAEHYWETGGKPVGPTEKRPGTPPTATRTRTAAASSTKSSASPSGTKRPARKAAKGPP